MSAAAEDHDGAKETHARYVLDTQGYWAYYLLTMTPAPAAAQEVKP